MSDVLITKRLHVSGLTPALTADDLKQRLSSFGTIRALDGFGLLDGLGQPRKFGYITIETTPTQLARCLNLLSGSTWKGAKLRIGEAKPDFVERISLEQPSSLDEIAKKKRKRSHAHGIQASDMSLVTPDNAAQRVGWTVTPLGRILRPVKMRPDRPLPPVAEIRDKKRIEREKSEEKRKRAKDPDSRARRRTIDMTRWGSVHLKGAFLDLEVVGTVGKETSDVAPDLELATDSSSESGTETGPGEMEVLEERSQAVEPNSTLQQPQTSIPGSTPDPAQALLRQSAAQASLLAEEKSRNFTLLASFFGGKADAEWVGREDLGSNVDEDEIRKAMVFENVEGWDGGDGTEEFEVVPLSGNVDKGMEPPPEDDERNVVDATMDVDPQPDLEPKVNSKPKPPPSATNLHQKRTPTKLKDLFAPREEETGFSLLGHLDLDLESDEEILFSVPPPTQDKAGDSKTRVDALSSTSTHPTTYLLPAPALTATYNPSLPFFFPSSASSSSRHHHKPSANNTQNVIPNWRDPAVSFFRTNTEEGIREKWEKERSELTQGWKKRWREAVKMKRRRGGTATGGAGDD